MCASTPACSHHPHTSVLLIIAHLTRSLAARKQTIDALHVREDTLLVFTADHGASFLGKGHAYEAYHAPPRRTHHN